MVEEGGAPLGEAPLGEEGEEAGAATLEEDAPAPAAGGGELLEGGEEGEMA
jgi:hypothetical protein